MMRNALALAIAGTLALAGCMEPDGPDPGVPEDVGLESGRPFPGPRDVCRIIGENALTSDYLDDSAVLVGCPVSEPGAIADRKAKGGRQLDQIGTWVLLSVPEN